MSTAVGPGGGQDGEEPLPAVPGDDWDADADMARVIAAIDAGEIRVPEGDGVPGAGLSVAGVADPGEADLAGLAQGGAIDVLPPGAVLAALADAACDPGVLGSLSDDQVLGLAAAGRRLAGRAAWITQTAVAEFAARRAEPDRKKATPLGFTLFAPDELVPGLVITAGAAELVMAQAREAARRLPGCRARLRDGLLGEFQMKIITEYTQGLSDAGAAEADLLLSAAAPGLAPGMLRAMCTRAVLMIDPRAARRRAEAAAGDARVTRFQEQSGTAALCGRDLPPDEVLAACAHIDACARELRAAGVAGTLQQLRVRAYLDLTQGRDPLDRVPADGNGGGTKARTMAPVKAVINLLVPAGTLYGWPAAPGEIPGFGLLDPQATRDLTQAAAAHPQTRWCVTVIGPDGTAAAHGCAPGRHRWTPDQGSTGPPPDQAAQAAQVTELLRRLRVQLAPIARGHCDHRHHSDRYVISRKLRHLLQARAATCTAPGCNRPAAAADADHTIPWPDGPSCECNLGAPCQPPAATTTAPSRPPAGGSNSPNLASCAGRTRPDAPTPRTPPGT